MSYVSVNTVKTGIGQWTKPLARRLGGGAAPLKENLAALILLRADWPGMAARGGALIDPMCGSGSFLLEGAMMAADIAPGPGSHPVRV